MTIRARFPRLYEVAWFTGTYFVAFALADLVEAYASGGDPKFSGPFGTFLFAVQLFVVPSSVAASITYSLARWSPGTGSLPTGRRGLAVLIAIVSVLAGVGIAALSEPFATDWRLMPWFFWILGGGPLIVTLAARLLIGRRAAARSVAA